MLAVSASALARSSARRRLLDAARGRERQAQTAGCGSQSGQGDVAGCRLAEPQAAKRSAANALRPDRRRELVDNVRSTWQVSIRRACSVLRRSEEHTSELQSLMRISYAVF